VLIIVAVYSGVFARSTTECVTSAAANKQTQRKQSQVERSVRFRVIKARPAREAETNLSADLGGSSKYSKEKNR